MSSCRHAGVRLSVFSQAKEMLAESKAAHVEAQEQWQREQSDSHGRPPRLRHKRAHGDADAQSLKLDSESDRPPEDGLSSQRVSRKHGGALIHASVPLQREV